MSDCDNEEFARRSSRPGGAGGLPPGSVSESNLDAPLAAKVNNAVSNNPSGSGAPGVNNDINDTVNSSDGVGFVVGSFWIDQAASPQESYRCVDSTDGAAVWILTTLTTDELAAVAISGSAEDLTEGATKKLLTVDERLSIAAVSKVSGVISGGVMTINGGDNTKIDITAGTGIIIDYRSPVSPVITEISWIAQIAVSIPDIATSIFTQFYFDSSGVLQQQTGLVATAQQKRQNVVLDAAIHTDSTVVNNIGISGILAYQTEAAILDFIQQLGSVNVGNAMSAAGANLIVQKSSGTTSLPFINKSNDLQDPAIISNPSQNPIAPWATSHRDGAGGFTTTTSISAIDPDQYDDGSGTLASVPNNNFTIQRFHFFGQVGGTIVTYGQDTYNNLATARAAILSEDPEIDPILLLNAKFVTALVVEEGATSLQDIATAQFFNITGETSSGSSPAQNIQDTYDLSTVPQLLIDAVKGALTVQSATGSDSDLIHETKNNAGSTKTTLDGAGNQLVRNLDTCSTTSVNQIVCDKDASGNRSVAYGWKKQGTIKFRMIMDIDADDTQKITLFDVENGVVLFEAEGEDFTVSDLISKRKPVIDSTTARTMVNADRSRVIDLTNALDAVITFNTGVGKAGESYFFTHKTDTKTVSFAGTATKEQDLLTNYTYVEAYFVADDVYRLFGS